MGTVTSGRTVCWNEAEGLCDDDDDDGFVRAIAVPAPLLFSGDCLVLPCRANSCRNGTNRDAIAAVLRDR